MTAAVFGQWLTSSQPQDHYFLDGEPLCGSPALPGPKRPDRVYQSQGKKTFAVEPRFRCPACKRLNNERWAAFTTPASAAPSPAPSQTPASSG